MSAIGAYLRVCSRCGLLFYRGFACGSHDFVEELTQYLVSNNLLKFVEVYVQKVSPQKTPAVVGKLLDLDQDEDFIKRLLDSVRHQCPVDPLVEQVESRNRLRLLQPWLEQRIAEGNTEAATHNAIGKIYITINKEPQTFLKCVLALVCAWCLVLMRSCARAQEQQVLRPACHRQVLREAGPVPGIPGVPPHTWHL
jgi:hypothetical protein